MRGRCIFCGAVLRGPVTGQLYRCTKCYGLQGFCYPEELKEVLELRWAEGEDERDWAPFDIRYGEGSWRAQRIHGVYDRRSRCVVQMG
jgi:hypothetical protein